MPDNRFTLWFNLNPLVCWDHLALLATQIYNLGRQGDWFLWFRRGKQGVGSRVYGIQRHYYELHAWLPRRRQRTEMEYHLASLFFNMDAALECFAYMMNALGNAIDPSAFKDISDQKSLRAIAPVNVTGDLKRPPLVGYQKFFPNVQALWADKRPLIELIMEQAHSKIVYRFLVRNTRTLFSLHSGAPVTT